MKTKSILILLLVPGLVEAGILGTAARWVVVTQEEDLVVNSDDYVGDFDGNPNQVNINYGAYRQSILSIERMIPTLPSGGITEYALALGGGINTSDEFVSGSPTALDSLFQVQLGFGTGENFVRALKVAPELRFDAPENVSPSVQDGFTFGSDIPVLKLIKQESDTLTYQGASRVGDIVAVEFWFDKLLRMPVDIPDLDSALRDFYSADDLELIPSTAGVPFTIRMRPIPEPSALILTVLGLFVLAVAARKRVRREVDGGRHVIVPVGGRCLNEQRAP
jgi:hypothetical protein